MNIEKKRVKYAKIDGLLGVVFLLLVIATFVTYFMYKESHPYVFISIGIVAIALRVATYILRWVFNS